MQIAYIPFGVTRPLLDGFWGTHSPKYASERTYTKTPYGKAIKQRTFLKFGAKLQQKTEAAKKATSGSIRNLYFSLNGAVDANLAMRYAVAKEQKTGRKWRMSLYSP